MVDVAAAYSCVMASPASDEASSISGIELFVDARKASERVAPVAKMRDAWLGDNLPP